MPVAISLREGEVESGRVVRVLGKANLPSGEWSDSGSMIDAVNGYHGKNKHAAAGGGALGVGPERW